MDQLLPTSGAVLDDPAFLSRRKGLERITRQLFEGVLIQLQLGESGFC